MSLWICRVMTAGGMAMVAPAHGQDLEPTTLESLSSIECLVPYVKEPIGLQQAISLSYEESPAIRMAQEDLKMADARKVGATAGFYPTLTASYSLQRFVPISESSPVSVDSTVVGGQSGQYTSYPSLTANWNIYNGGRDLSALREADATHSASASGLNSQINDTSARILSAYARLLMTQARLVNNDRNLRIHEGLVTRAEERFKYRSGTLIALNQSRMAYAKAERELVKSCGELAVHSGALTKEMGVTIPYGHLLLADGAIPAAPESVLGESPVDSAVQNDPEAVAAREKTAAAQHRLDQARGAFLPTVSLTARYDWMGARREGFDKAMDATYADSYRYGLTLQQPLYPFARYQGGTRSAEAELDKSRTEYKATVVKLSTQVRSALTARDAAIATENSARKSWEEATSAVRLSEALFKGGRTDSDTVERARLDANSERAAYEEASSDRMVSDWLVFRSLHPNEFAAQLYEASGPLAETRAGPREDR